MNFDQLLDATVSGLGYELVECERSGKTGLLRIFVDKAGGISVDDCARISQHLSQVLTVEGVDYGRLEISSPGLDRILRTEHDFARFSGRQVRLKLRVAVNGQRNFAGELRGALSGKLQLESDGKLLLFELGNLDKVRLIPNI